MHNKKKPHSCEIYNEIHINIINIILCKYESVLYCIFFLTFTHIYALSVLPHKLLIKQEVMQFRGHMILFLVSRTKKQQHLKCAASYDVKYNIEISSDV